MKTIKQLIRDVNEVPSSHAPIEPQQILDLAGVFWQGMEDRQNSSRIPFAIRAKAIEHYSLSIRASEEKEHCKLEMASVIKFHREQHELLRNQYNEEVLPGRRAIVIEEGLWYEYHMENLQSLFHSVLGEMYIPNFFITKTLKKDASPTIISDVLETLVEIEGIQRDSEDQSRNDEDDDDVEDSDDYEDDGDEDQNEEG